MLRFSCFVRRFLLSKLAGEPVCINLISFWTSWWFSLDFHFSFFHNMQAYCFSFCPPICFTPFCYFLHCCFLQFLVLITELSTPCLWISVPYFASDSFAAFFGSALLKRVFSFCNEQDHLLIFLTVIKRTFIMTTKHFPSSSSDEWTCYSPFFFCFTLLLPTFWVAFLLFFSIYRSICFLFISVVRQKPGFRFSLVLRFSCFVLRFQPLKLSGMPVCTNLINFRTVSLISEDFSFTFHIVQAHCYSFFPLVCFTLIVICSALLLSVWNVYHYWSELSLLLFKFSDIASDCFAAFFRNIFSCESFCFATDGITCWSSLQSLKERFVVVTT